MEMVFTPKGRLSTYVRMMWLNDGYTPSSSKERVLPSTACQLIINLAGAPFRHFDKSNPDKEYCYDSAVLTGIRSHHIFLDSYSRISTIGVIFRTGAIPALFGIPAYELHNQVVSLKNVLNTETSRLLGTLEEAADPNQKIRIVANFLMDLLDKDVKPNPAIQHSVHLISKTHGTTPIAEIRDHIGYSRRHFSHLFKKLIGLTPKQYARLSRFQHALDIIHQCNISDWTRFALGLGYYDQSHFIHDFQSFSDLSPDEYRRYKPKQKNHIPM
ncbi:helix-turn-helix domain-containing protein [Fodinibius salsisoli]|uniref:AraC family transcriptional regulator n=1 Tax=Fodinibius salsisoli TaxID=2820877 RepID=A0ABT3PHW5_9BACT|nr:helix-turn-helix domain-containing protein [Fodinibius salsisoli]MCW9705490.1 AraC family transcriptional regulator [Fodinibius salsisoli]